MAKREAGIAVRIHPSARRPVDAPDGFLAALEALPDQMDTTWTERELAIVRRYYGRRRLADIAAALGRSLHAIKSLTKRMRRRGDLTPL
jgi:DNA-directed RNA polymerase specialized sigma24 family protein